MSAMYSRYAAAVVLLALAGCAHESKSSAGPGAESAAAWLPIKVAAEHLPNLYRLHEKVLSGGQPDGEEGFRELQSLGVKTLISVDGAKPDVALAQRYGLRYVHMPHGYDGVPDDRARELAKAVRDLPGPIYIHCHHGKHRSPTAASLACVAVGFLEPPDALAVLRAAGTSENYRGLYQSAESARRLDEALLDALRVEFHQTVDLPPLADAMVAIERVHDRLHLIELSGWHTPAEHPDLDPPHEALLLREQFTELLRTDEVHRQPESFQELMRESEQAALDLEASLNINPGAQNLSQTASSDAFARITKGCKSCHQKFRDVPLSEKAK